MKQKRLGKRIAEGIICLAIMLTIVNLPVFTNEVNAAEYSYIVSGTKQQYIHSIYLIIGATMVIAQYYHQTNIVVA